MRSPRFQGALHQGHIAKPLQHFPMGNGMLALTAIWKYLHHLAVFGTASHMSYNCAFIRFWLSPNQSQIGALNGVVKKLSRQWRHGLFCFGNHQQARSILVNPMNQTWAAYIAFHFRQVLKMIHQPIHQGSRPIAMSRVNDHPWRLIDHQQIRILIDNVQMNILRNHLGITRRLL